MGSPQRRCRAQRRSFNGGITQRLCAARSLRLTSSDGFWTSAPVSCRHYAPLCAAAKSPSTATPGTFSQFQASSFSCEVSLCLFRAFSRLHSRSTKTVSGRFVSLPPRHARERFSSPRNRQTYPPRVVGWSQPADRRPRMCLRRHQQRCSVRLASLGLRGKPIGPLGLRCKPIGPLGLHCQPRDLLSPDSFLV